MHIGGDVGLLLRCLEAHPVPSCQEPGLALLWGLGADAPGVARVAQHGLESSSARVQTYAAAVLGRLEKPGDVGQQLLKALKSHPECRMLQERVYETLLKLLQDNHGLDLPLRALLKAMKKHPGGLRLHGGLPRQDHCSESAATS